MLSTKKLTQAAKTIGDLIKKQDVKGIIGELKLLKVPRIFRKSAFEWITIGLSFVEPIEAEKIKVIAKKIAKQSKVKQVTYSGPLNNPNLIPSVPNKEAMQRLFEPAEPSEAMRKFAEEIRAQTKTPPPSPSEATAQGSDPWPLLEPMTFNWKPGKEGNPFQIGLEDTKKSPKK